MTTFWRSGYWRTSKHGNVHWVQDHEVTRDEWDRVSYGSGALSYACGRLTEMRAGGSVAATYVNPNATCPVCGANVFFYQNEYGSRVYFDDLGPPWPKHPCTDSSDYQGRVPDATQTIEPAFRALADVTAVQRWLHLSEIDTEANFFAKHQLAPWTPYRLEWRYKQRRKSILILHRLSDEKPPRLFLTIDGLPQHVRVGQIIFYHRCWISCFDSRSGVPIDLPAIRIRSSRRLVDALIAAAEFELGCA